MKINNKFIYKLSDRLGTLVVEPLGENDFSLDFSRENDDKISYEKQLSGKIVFVGDAYGRFMQMENSIYRCDEQTLSIFKMCGNEERLYFSGKISLNEAEFDLDKCTIVLKYSKDKTDKCFEDGKSLKLNLFQFVQNRITVKTSSFVSVLETKNCFSSQSSENDYWCGSGDPYSQNWTLISYRVYSPDGTHNYVSNTWGREIVEIGCSEIPDPNWVLIEDNCGSTNKKKYAKAVTLFDCIYSNSENGGVENPEGDNPYSFEMNCKVIGFQNGTTTIDNGLELSEAMVQIVRGACPLLTLKSDFFQINPENPSSINYVTGKVSTVNNIVVFQKSDVKRPTATGNANKLEISLEEMLEVLLKMFSVKWRIEGDIFRLEHVSYYSKEIGFDATSEALKKYIVGKKKYTYQSEKIPNKEIFRFKEQQGGDWNLEVVYSGCVTNTKNNEVTNLIDNAMTDVIFAIQNPDSDSKFVEDAGFVLISTKKIGSEYFINSEPSPNGSRLNNVFSWVALFRDFHYYERPMKTGKVNGIMTEFITTIPTKKGETFAIPFNFCTQNFNPDNFVKTALGNGIVSSAKHRFKDYFLELELLYESNQNLVPNTPPVLVGGGFFNVYQNVPLLIDIEATDTDGFITGINVLTQPTRGVLEIISFTQLKYSPNLNALGFDNFRIQAVDNFSEVSNIAVFGIEILAENVPPVANDDNFFVWIGETFNQGSSIISNDTDDYNSISLITTNATTAQGVLVTISPTGFFGYVPPVGFEGVDSFQYTIKDNLNQESTATVFLTVANKNRPIAVADNYQTTKNVALTVDGSGIGKEKLTANDYTPDGNSYTYTTTAETKATTQGGSVTINADGTFVYTPLTGFVGNDSFNYTVANSNGSAVGIVNISVLPTIYVKLTTNDQTNVGHIGEPVFYRTRDYILNFYSDDGITPIDVTGMNFKVKLKHVISIISNEGIPSGGTNIYETESMSGVSRKIYDDLIYYQRDSDGYSYDETITIENGAYIII